MFEFVCKFILFQFLRRLEHTAGNRLGTQEPVDSLFRLETEERYECAATHQVRYKTDSSVVLSLRVTNELMQFASAEREQKRLKVCRTMLSTIGTESLRTFLIIIIVIPINKQGDVDAELDRPQVDFNACLEAFAAEEIIHDFYSSATRNVGNGIKTTRVSVHLFMVHVHCFFSLLLLLLLFGKRGTEPFD
jgi:hypothetical protein